METIEEIVGEMRGWWVHNDNEEVDSVLTAFADRIEAAHKRESVKDCHALNAAKMHEALNQLLGLIDNEILVFNDDLDLSDISQAQYQIDKADAALAEPPRNCDRFDCEEDAWDAYCEVNPNAQCPSDEYEMWLFAEVKGETK